MKIVYIAHPIGGNVEENLKKIANILYDCNFSDKEKIVPFAPYLADLTCMNDDNPNHRAQGMQNNKQIFLSGVIDELRLYGDRISEGMEREIFWARSMNIPIKPMTNQTKAALNALNQ